jgi:hypothetical protein
VDIFTFLAAWGDLLMALSLITDEAMRPVTSGLFKYMGNNVSQWNMVMGFATLEMIPPLVLFFGGAEIRGLRIDGWSRKRLEKPGEVLAGRACRKMRSIR